MSTITAREAYQIWKRDFRRGRLLDDYTDFNARFRDMAYTTGLMPLPSGWTIPRWTMGMVFGGRGSIGHVLGRSQGAVAPWWLSGGVSAANAIAAYQPKGAASLAASYTNLANHGTYNAAPGTAPTFNASTGWTFNGSTQYLTTGIRSSSTWTVLIRFANFTTGSNKSLCGAYSTSGGQHAIQQQSTLLRYFNALNTDATRFSDVAPNLASGVVGIAGKQPYRNGSTDGSAIVSSTWNTSIFWYIGALNIDGAASQFSAFDCLAFAIYNTTLTAPQVSAISTAMAAL